MLRDAISSMSGPGVAVSTTDAAAKSMMVEKSGMTIPYRIEAGILLYLDSSEWQGAKGLSQTPPTR
jgi:hypothetical protein